MESETNQGKKCLIFENNKFTLKNVGKKLTSWKCTTKTCNVLIHADLKGIVLEDSVAHNHADKVLNVAAHTFKVKVKQTGSDDYSKAPRKVVGGALETLGSESADVTREDVAAAKQAHISGCNIIS